VDDNEPRLDELPSGTVTFLFTDIEGSTRLERDLRERYSDVLSEHQQLLREAFATRRSSAMGSPLHAPNAVLRLKARRELAVPRVFPRPARPALGSVSGCGAGARLRQHGCAEPVPSAPRRDWRNAGD
jgi:class 3 adenylate cyclase